MRDYVYIPRWEPRRFLESRLDSFRKGEIFAALCKVSSGDFRVHIELPPSKRLSGLAYREFFLSEAFAYFCDLEDWETNTLRAFFFNRLQFGGTVLGGYLGAERDAEYALSMALRIFDQDATDQRYEVALASTPRNLTEQDQALGIGHIFNSEGNLGQPGVCGLPENIRDDFGLQPVQEWPRDEWRTVREIYLAAANFHWELLKDFDEIVILEETQHCSTYDTGFLMERFKAMQFSTAKDFTDQIFIGTDFRLPEPPPLETKAHLIPIEECESYAAFHEAHPHAQGVLAFSKPGFNQERTEALVTIKNHADLGLLSSLNAGKSTLQIESLLLLRKQGEEWSVEGSYTLEDRLVEQVLQPLPHRDFPEFWETRSIPELFERLRELSGFSECQQQRSKSILTGEKLLGVYKNRRLMPEELFFSDRGILIRNAWSELHLPYSSISSAKSGRVFEINLHLKDGRVVSTNLDGLRKTNNLYLPNLDCDWLCEWLRALNSLQTRERSTNPNG